MTKLPDLFRTARAAAPDDEGGALRRSLEGQVLRESHAMARFALARGQTVPAPVIEALAECSDAAGEDPAAPAEIALAASGTMNGEQLRRLVGVHTRLAKIVAPALPGSILFLADQRRKPAYFRFLGPVPVIRQMTVAAALCLVLFVALSLSTYVNASADASNVFRSSGLPLLINEMFLIAAAGLGASFAALFRANRFVVEGTFNPTYDTSYWSSFALGVIAGIILSQLIPFEDDAMRGLARPTLAMLGGFSSQVVYRILRRLISTVDSLVRGETRDIVEAQERSAKSRLSEQALEARMDLAANLVRLQQTVADGGDSAAVKQRIAELLDQLLPNEMTQLEGDPAAPAAERPAAQAEEKPSPAA